MKIHYLIIVALLSFSCTSKNAQPLTSADPLPSWNHTETKQAIVDFVKQTTDALNAKFIPISDRIAVFDNDGTLWCEQPLYIEMIYSIEATRIIAGTSAELMKKPEIKVLAKGNDAAFIIDSGEKGILEAFAISHTSIKPERFNDMASAWLDTATHDRFKRKYTELIYQPMVELLQYLRDNGYKTYIVSGGSSMFMRNFSNELYGVPAEQVIGTMFKAEYDPSTQGIVIKPALWHNDDKGGKPAGIFQIIGRKPVLAFGNSDGDLQMLEWTSTNSLPNLSLILHHTDAEREYAYDRTSTVGTLDKALDEGKAKGWVIVDMKRDFKKVFAFE